MGGSGAPVAFIVIVIVLTALIYVGLRWWRGEDGL